MLTQNSYKHKNRRRRSGSLWVLCSVSARMSASGEFSLWEYLFTTRPGVGWVKGTASLTGVILQLLIFLMVICSSTFVRRSGHFEVRVRQPSARPVLFGFCLERRFCPPAGVLLDSPVLHLGLDPPHHPLCKLLEVVCGSRSGFPAGEDRRNRRVSDGRSLHRGGQPAAVQGVQNTWQQRFFDHFVVN